MLSRRPRNVGFRQALGSAGFRSGRTFTGQTERASLLTCIRLCTIFVRFGPTAIALPHRRWAVGATVCRWSRPVVAHGRGMVDGVGHRAANALKTTDMYCFRRGDPSPSPCMVMVARLSAAGSRAGSGRCPSGGSRGGWSMGPGFRRGSGPVERPGGDGGAMVCRWSRPVVAHGQGMVSGVEHRAANALKRKDRQPCFQRGDPPPLTMRGDGGAVIGARVGGGRGKGIHRRILRSPGMR
jgi:hypothetical protein